MFNTLTVIATVLGYPKANKAKEEMCFRSLDPRFEIGPTLTFFPILGNLKKFFKYSFFLDLSKLST